MMLLEWDAMLVDRQRYVCPFLSDSLSWIPQFGQELGFHSCGCHTAMVHISVAKDQRLVNVLGLCDVRVISASEILSDATYILSKMMNTPFKSLLCVELFYPIQEKAALLRSLHSSRKSIWKISCLFYVLSARIHGSRVKDTCTYLQWGSSLVTSTATCNENLWNFEDWLFSVAPNLLVQLEFILLSGLEKKRWVDLSHRIELNPLLLDVNVGCV